MDINRAKRKATTDQQFISVIIASLNVFLDEIIKQSESPTAALNKDVELQFAA